MGLFEVCWKGSSERDLRRIDKQYIPGILKAIESLVDNPIPSPSKKLAGSESSYRLRIRDYRVIYQVDLPEKTVIIYHVRHRKDAYRK